MRKVFLLAAILAAAAVLCSCGRMYSCDVYYYSSGWSYIYSEGYYGSSPSSAEDNCENSYGSYYDCRDCT